MSIVPLEGLADFARQFCVESLTAKLRLLNRCLRKILIVEVIESPVFLLRHISQPMEGLDIYLVDMLEYGVRNDYIRQNITILNYIELVECKMVIYDKDFVDNPARLNIIVGVIDTGHDSIGLRCGCHPSQL